MKACFLTGCDNKKLPQLEWFCDNFNKNMNSEEYISLSIADFGFSDPKTLNKFTTGEGKVYGFEDNFIRHARNDLPRWTLKPLAIKRALEDFEEVVWIDTDCEILEDISEIFSFHDPHKINLVRDEPWTMRRGQVWHNTGVIGVSRTKRVKNILDHWISLCQNMNANFDPNFAMPPKGDQDALHEMAGQGLSRLNIINTLPYYFNYLRLQMLDDRPNSKYHKVMHWTGQMGDLVIEDKIKNGNC